MSVSKNAFRIIRMSERYITSMNELRVRDIMEDLEDTIKTWPGLLKIETLIDTKDVNRHVVVTEWENRDSLNNWLKSDICQKVINDLSKVLDKKPTYQEFIRHEEDVFSQD